MCFLLHAAFGTFFVRFATIVYNVTCSHDQKILAVSSGTYGSCNDKTLIRFDDFIRELRENKLYTEDTKYGLIVSPRIFFFSLLQVFLFFPFQPTSWILFLYFLPSMTRCVPPR